MSDLYPQPWEPGPVEAICDRLEDVAADILDASATVRSVSMRAVDLFAPKRVEEPEPAKNDLFSEYLRQKKAVSGDTVAGGD